MGRIRPVWLFSAIVVLKYALFLGMGSHIASGSALWLALGASCLINVAGSFVVLRQRASRVFLAVTAAALLATDAYLLLSNALAEWGNPPTVGLRGESARPAELVDPSRHLRGQRTIRRKPHGAAQLLVEANAGATHCVCVDPGQQVPLSVRFSHTIPAWVTYGIKSLDDPQARVTVVNHTVSSAELAELAHSNRLPLAEDADEYALIRGRAPAARVAPPSPSALPDPDAQRAPWRYRQYSAANSREDDEPELLLHLPVSSPGRVRLLRAADALGREATINPSYSAELIVAECPAARWGLPDISKPLHACRGDGVELPLQVSGVGPLELGWSWSPLLDGLDVPDVSNRVERVLSQLSDKEAAEEALTQGSFDASVDWARRQHVSLSLRFAFPMPASTPNQPAYQVRLDAVQDACGNVNLSPVREAARNVFFHPRPHVYLAPSAANPSVEPPLLAGAPRTLVKLDSSSRHKAEAQSTPAVAVSAPDADGGWKATLQFVPSAPGVQARMIEVEGAHAKDVQRITADEPGAWSVASAGSEFCAPRPPGTDLSSLSLTSNPGPAPVRVAAVPPPHVNITLAPISDACSGPVGVRARASFLSGSPPYTLTYHVKGGGQDLERTWRAESREAEITLDVPPSVLARRGRKGAWGGEVHYTFRSLRDKYYDFASLDGPKMTQTVHPPLMASLSSTQPRYASTCLNDSFTPHIALSGSGPLTLTYSLAGSEGGSVTHTVGGLQPGMDVPLEVALPSLPEAGSYVDDARVESTTSFTLLSVKDARGCQAKIPPHRAGVAVRRRLAAPQASFASDGAQDVVVPHGLAGTSPLAEGQEVSLPLRLTGRTPWTLSYSKDGGPLTVHTVHSAPSGVASLDVDSPGVYSLHSLLDADCPGVIDQQYSTWRVALVPRPRVAFAPMAGSPSGEAEASDQKEGEASRAQTFSSSWLSRNKVKLPSRAISNSGPVTLVRRPVCLRQPDDAPLSVSPGEAWPVQIIYEHTAWAPGAAWRSNNDANGQQQTVDAHTFSAAQATTFLPLNTSVPGEHTYTLTQVGDDIYPPSRLVNDEGNESIRLKQVVHPPPSARFVDSDLLQACVGDLIPSLGSDLVRQQKASFKSKLSSSRPFHASYTPGEVHLPEIEIRGVPPFVVDLALSAPNGTHTKHTVTIPAQDSGFTHRATTMRAQVSLGTPALPLDVAGKWSVSIVGIQDGACAGPLSSQGERDKIVIEVHDTPSARPLLDHEMCVGNVLGYGLSGQAPWEVTYIFTPASALPGANSEFAPTNPEALRAAEPVHGVEITSLTSKPTFTRLASAPGRVRLVRVSHPRSPCPWSPPAGSEEAYATLVRDLPSVMVDHGAPDEQTLFEGATALVKFSLQGEPPFAFTYQRTEPVDLVARPKVLDTQTAEDVTGPVYTLSTAEEGTWQVINLADRYCSVSAATEAKGRALLTEHGGL